MKISLNWLNEYVTLPEDVTPQRLAEALTMSTVEVEGVEPSAHQFEKMVVGKIKELQRHPKADRLQLALTDIGRDEPATIVCGGSNLSVGMQVAVALPGAKVLWHGTGEPIELGTAEIRGIKSFGMICASNEIGLADLFPASQEKEIIDLGSAGTLSPGAELADALGLNDVLLTIDNKSLTNRPDLWGHYGIARELSAIFDVPLRDLSRIALPAADPASITVQIAAAESCYRYMGVVLGGLENQTAPCFIRRRLASVGQRAINLLVDLTNYVMLAVGQPLHVFDRAKLEGHTIEVRNARSDERCALLDGKSYTLTDRDIVIADGVGPVALAGIMGGSESSVNVSTTRVLLEAATFEPITIRRTGARLGLRTESSMRFEKGLDTERPEIAVSHFLSLLKEVQPGCSIEGAADALARPQPPVAVEVRRDFIVSRIGKDIPAAPIVSGLERLGFTVQLENDTFRVQAPVHRATGDVSIPEDIVEEVARLIGYDNLEFVPPPVFLEKAVLQPELALHRSVKEYLAFTAGMNEVFTYPWVEESLLLAAGIDLEECVKLFAPPSSSTQNLQPSLVPAMLHAVERNMRFLREFSVFEMARVFQKDKVAPESSGGEKLPHQPKFLAGAVAGTEDRAAYLKAKGIVTGLFAALRLPEIQFVLQKRGLPWGAPGTTLSLQLGDETEIGALALLSPAVRHKLGTERGRVAIFEINLTLLSGYAAETKLYDRLPEYPVVEFDMALLFDRATPWQKIESIARSSNPLITDVQFFDEYRGGQVPPGKKSVALKLILQDPEATLTSERIKGVTDHVTARLKEELGGELRS